MNTSETIGVITGASISKVSVVVTKYDANKSGVVGLI